MAFDAYMKIDGIPGESADKDHKEWIELLSFSHKMEQPAQATASTAGGATYGRVVHSPFVVTHYLDKSSPKLYDACCSGTHIKEVVIDFCRAGNGQVRYFQVKLEQVIISRIEPVGTTADTDLPVETLSLSYGRIRWTYTQQSREDGSGGAQIIAAWDLTNNRKAA